MQRFHSLSGPNSEPINSPMRILSFALLTCLLLAGCRDDIDDFTVITNTPSPAIDIRTTITGTIVDDNFRPLAGVDIQLYNDQTTTTADGRFTFTGIIVPSTGALIKYAKPGYRAANRHFLPLAGGDFDVVLQLEQTFVAGTIDATTGGAVSLPSGVRLFIRPGSVLQNGGTYTGSVNVGLYWDNPNTIPEMIQSAGNTPAYDDNGELLSLESYGMIGLEMTTPSGIPLQVNSSNPALLSFPIDNNSVEISPDSIPLWILNEEEVAWVELADITREEGRYIAPVTIGGTYNCDVPYPANRICGRIITEDGEPFQHTSYAINVAGGQIVHAFYTDCNGNFCALVPKDTELELSIQNPCDSSSRISIPIGPFNQDSEVFDDYVIPINAARTAVNVTSCNGTPFAEGLTYVEAFGNQLITSFASPDANGNTAIVAAICMPPEEIYMQAATLDSRHTSQLIRRSADNELPLDLIICSELENLESFTLNIDGSDIMIEEASLLYRPSTDTPIKYYIRAGRSENDRDMNLLIGLSELSPGTYNPPAALASVFDTEAGGAYNSGISYRCPSQACDFSLTITDVGPDSAWVSGNFSFTAERYNNQTQQVEATNISITGTFRKNI